MERPTRKERREAERALDEAMAPGPWLLRRLIPYGATLSFLGALHVLDDAQMGVPIAATAIFWGMGIATGFLRRQQRGAIAARQSDRLPDPLLDAEREKAKQAVSPPRPTGPSRPVPESVADIAELVARLVAGLTRHNQPKLATRLGEGLTEVVRLAGLADGSGMDLDALRAEIAALDARAAATTDPEAADLWRNNARAAGNRLEKALALAAAADRTHARIESFRQTVKSLAVDLARLDLASEDPTLLTAVDQHASLLERDVEALARTNRELASLDAGAEPRSVGMAARAAQRTV